MEVQGYCALCRSRCGTVNVVDGGILVQVRANPAHPTGTGICPKGEAAPEIVYNENRLLYPLRRTAPKGSSDPGWERISWDVALDTVANHLARIKAQHGAEAVGFSVATPSGTPLVDSIEWIDRFIRCFGSPNTYGGVEICNWHKDVAHTFTFGCATPAADYSNSDLIILWGHNPPNVWLAQAHAIARGRSRGAKLMVVDPRATSLAKGAEHWLRVRPGSDAALALGLIHLLIETESYDQGFVRTWTNAPFLVRSDTGRFLTTRDIDPSAETPANVVWHLGRSEPQPYDASQDHSADSDHFALNGTFSVFLPASGNAVTCRPAFDLLREQASKYPPARVADLTWLDERQLRGAARTLAKSRHVSYHAWTGVAQHTNATQMERSIAVLYSLTGCFDTKGGNVVYRKPPVNPATSPDLLDPGQAAKAIGLDRFPLGPPAQGRIVGRDFFQAILTADPYPIKALVAFGGNPVLAQVGTARVQEALRRVEFYVHCDLFHTPTSDYADIILPTNSPWEHDALKVGFEISAEAEELVMLRQKVVLPRGESKADYQIVFELAEKLGMGGQFFDGNIETAWNHVLSPLGATVDKLRLNPEGVRYPQQQGHAKYAEHIATGVRGFATETRRAEIYSEKLLRHGYPPLPQFSEPTDGPNSDPQFPLILSSTKNRNFCQSQHRSVPSLRKRSPVPLVLIHPSLAQQKGVREGDWVELTTRIGAARFVAHFDESLHERVVLAEHGWWEACPEVAQPGYPVLGPGSSNFNALISWDHTDPISGSVPQRSFACDVRPCA